MRRDSRESEEAGHVVAAEVDHAAALLDHAINSDAELMICSSAIGDEESLGQVLKRVFKIRPLPLVVVSPPDQVDEDSLLMEDVAMTYLVETKLSVEDLRPAIQVVRRRFQELQSLRRENADLRNKLSPDR